MELHKRHWVKKVEEWKDSGLSKTEFCAREGINRGTFSTWWRRYKAQVKGEPGGSFVEITPNNEGLSKKKEETSEYPAEISAAGFTVRINGNADSSLIESIFKALEGRLCS
jgi:transposase-like protein